MISAELQTAIDSLQIQDIYLRNLISKCEGDFDPKHDADVALLEIQTMHHVRQSMTVELDNKENMLRVFVVLGIRWVDEKEPDEGGSVKAMIEAEFVAEYAMKKILDEASVDEFSLKNVSYHVWPYWRELLSSQCERMHLPRAVLPMSQIAHNHDAKRLLDQT